ncbi:hypothetical protein [Abyssisolibacter fermentans]|uniref:hypothetical protein n=1 Tax=Abyssisolibacter fermentans TaxID=1766203 RepID=UPI00082DD504|nr:hypothetical protein [Abyssisolibacter fermentans]
MQKVEIEYYKIDTAGNYKKTSTITLNTNTAIKNYIHESSENALTEIASIGDVKVITEDMGIVGSFEPYEEKSALYLPSIIGTSIGLVAGAFGPVAGVIGSIIGTFIPPAQQPFYKNPLVETKHNRILFSRDVLIYTEYGWQDYAASARLDTELIAYFSAYNENTQDFINEDTQDFINEDKDYGTIKIEYGENYDKELLTDIALDVWMNNRSKYVEYYHGGPEEINSSIIDHFEECAKEW